MNVAIGEVARIRGE